MFIELSTLNLAKGLIILIIVNITLGSFSALFNQAFDWKKLFQGIIKGTIIAICFFATYYAGHLNPDIIAVNVNGEEVNLLTACYLILFSGFVFYAGQVSVKFVSLIKGHITIGEGK